MKRLTIIMLSLSVCGCATAKTYYACRDGGGTREYCSSYADTPTGNVLANPGPILADDGAMQTAAVGSR